MPRRVMRVHALELVEVRDGIVRLDLHVGSGTYVRSIADALGGHCVTLRRTEIGPFSWTRRISSGSSRWTRRSHGSR